MSDLGNKEVMAKNIKRFLLERGMTRKDLCDALGFKYSTVTEWLRAAKYPRIDKIEMMANYFGCSKADLVEAYHPEKFVHEEIEPYAYHIHLTPKEEDHIRKYRTLTPERRAYIDGQISAFLSEK